MSSSVIPMEGSLFKNSKGGDSESFQVREENTSTCHPASPQTPQGQLSSETLPYVFVYLAIDLYTLKLFLINW